MVNQAINGKKMEKEVFKRVNLQHSPKALTRLLLQVHMSVREQGSSWKAGKKIILGWNMMTLKMKCSVCCVENTPRLPIAQARFFLGTQSFRLQNIKVHGKSQGHWKCFEADKAAKNPDAGILQNIRNMNEQLQEKMLKLFNIAYYLAVNERPMSDFASLCTLQIKNSVDLGDFYLNDKRCKDFLESISAVAVAVSVL